MMDLIKNNPELLLKVLSAVVDLVILIAIPLAAVLLRSTKYREKVCQAATLAYFVVEKIASKTPGKIDDKLALALKRMADELGHEPTDDEKKIAEQTFELLAAKH